MTDTPSDVKATARYTPRSWIDRDDCEISGLVASTNGEYVLYSEFLAEYNKHQAEIEALRKERDEARETNSCLNRRIQKLEGGETSFRMRFLSWKRVLWGTRYEGEGHALDFIDWLKNIDKEWANSRAAHAEAKLANAVKALEPFGESYVAMSVDEDGWTNGVQRERIVDWFGPSDFRLARATLTTIKGTANAALQVKP